MQTVPTAIRFVLDLTKTQAILTRRFDSALGGISLNEFTILHNLSVAPEEKLRRIDLANKIGLTASGVTRLLLPMEKIGLVKSGASEQDARARYVMIAPGGKQKLNEAMERVELLMQDLVPAGKNRQLAALSEFLTELGARSYLS